MTKSDVEMKEESQKNDPDSEEPQAEVSKEEKERLALEGELHIRNQAPVVQRADNFIHWISRYATNQFVQELPYSPIVCV